MMKYQNNIYSDNVVASPIDPGNNHGDMGIAAVVILIMEIHINPIQYFQMENYNFII